MEEAKDLHKDNRTMGLWIQWWLLPHFKMLIQQGELKKGTKEMKMNGYQCKYNGYVNKAGKCYGVGNAIFEYGDKLEGTWIDNYWVGVRKCTAKHPQNICSHHHCRCIHTH